MIRTTRPAKNNKYYLHGGGGYNKCIRIKGNFVLDNCVGYCYGAFLEECGRQACKLPTSDAETWYGHNDGYPRGSLPAVGAIICWRKGKIGRADGCGHVAMVTSVSSDLKTISIFQSGYSAKKCWGSILKKPYKIAGYTFQGFIYNPYLVPSGTVNRKKGTKADVVQVQAYLRYRGLYKGAIDGSFGTQTYNAVRAFQVKNRLKTDGSVGPKTIALMKVK